MTPQVESKQATDSTRSAGKERQWLFSAEELRRTPSSQSGHSIEREKTERMKGCDFVLKVGMKLRLPQPTLATACVFLHRFYMRFPLREFHHYEIGATALFLATKCEETGRKLSDNVIACAKTAIKNDSAVIDEQSKDYWRWRDVILYNEELLLEALCFDLVIEHPFTHLKHYWRQFGGLNEVAKTAWCVANDTYRTTICLMYDSKTIAVACLYYASVFSNLPLEKVDGKVWYETIEIDMKAVLEVITIIVELYESAQQIVKDGYDPKALAKAGTEAHRQLQADWAKRQELVDSLAAKSSQDALQPSSNGSAGKRPLSSLSNGAHSTASKKSRLETQNTSRPGTGTSEGEIKEDGEVGDQPAE